MPASPQRRKRTVRPVEDVTDGVPGEVTEPEPAEVPEAFATRSKSQVRRVQAATTDPKVKLPPEQRAADTDDGLKAPLAGEYFRLEERIGLLPLMEWAAGLDQVNVMNSAQLAGWYRLLKAIVHPDDWDAFRRHATEKFCGDEELLAFQNAAIEAMTARPTKAPEAS